MIGFEREDDEILRYYERVQPHDIFGIWGTELLLRLPLAKAGKFMKPDHGWTPETWEKAFLKKDHDSILNEMEDLFQFAIEKSITHRGNGASRCVVNYLVYAWLLNDMELFAYLMEGRNYPNYGAPMFLAVAQKYDCMDLLPMNKIDHDVFMRMSKGQICSELCNGGCRVGAPGQFRPLGLILPPNGGTQLVTPK